MRDLRTMERTEARAILSDSFKSVAVCVRGMLLLCLLSDESVLSLVEILETAYQEAVRCIGAPEKVPLNMEPHASLDKLLERFDREHPIVSAPAHHSRDGQQSTTTTRHSHT